MKKEDLFEALEGASDAYLESAAEAMMAKADTVQTVIPGGGKHRRWTQFLKQPRSWISAACILLSVSLLAVTLLLGSMYGFHLGPLDSGVTGTPNHTLGCILAPGEVTQIGETPEYIKRKLQKMVPEFFKEMPWRWNIDTILENAEKEGYLVLENTDILQGEDLLEAFLKQSQKGKSVILPCIDTYLGSDIKIIYFDGTFYHQIITSESGREYFNSYPCLLRFERTGEDEKGSYMDTVYYLGDLEVLEIKESSFGTNFVIVDDNSRLYSFDVLGCGRNYVKDDNDNTISLRYNQDTKLFEVVYPDGRKETYRECDLFTVIRDALHGDYITDPFSSAVPEGFYIASFETPVKLSPVDPETLDIDSLPSPFSNKDNEAVFMSKDCLWLKIGTDWYACARENLPWVK